MIELSTTSTFTPQERMQWCSEAKCLLEELHDEIAGSGDISEWHVRDVLALSYFQHGIIQYEEKVIKAMKNIDCDVSELVADCSVSDDGKGEDGEVDNTYLKSEDYIDQQFIASLNMAVELWREICEAALHSDEEKGDCGLFYDGEESAKCLYHTAVLYSLLSQNLYSVKASYLSGLIYEMLSHAGGSECNSHSYQEKQVVSWVLTASQFLLVENVANGEKILDKLEAIENCSVFSRLHIGVLKAAYLLYSGKIASSAESFHNIVNNEALNDNTKSQLVIKSDIYFLVSHLKLLNVKEGRGEVVIPNDQHLPLKSPFPPMSDCLRYLRSLYSKYVEEPGIQGAEVIVSSWSYLDKLLLCLTRNAQLLKYQGSILEAKKLLKEALLLTRKYHLSLRTLEILQQLASMDIIVNNQLSFDQTIDTVTRILKSTVDGCFCEANLLAPHFVTHDVNCACSNCIYPKLQEIHICLYLQYVEGRQHFANGLPPYKYNTCIDVIDTLVDNAYSRYYTSFSDINRIINMSLPTSCAEHVLSKPCEKVTKAGKKPRRINNKSTKIDNSCQPNTLPNVFSRYSFEAKLNHSIKENRNMIEIVEKLILKVEMPYSFEQSKYHRLVAQLYCLRTLLYVGSDIVERSWLCEADDNVENNVSVATPAMSTSNKRGRKRAPLNNKADNINTGETPQPAPRKGKGRTAKKGRSKVQADEGNIETTAVKPEKRSIESDIMECLEDLQKSLTTLNPYTDTLIIKAIYQLLILLSGTSNKCLTISCQLLSSSRTLHQQILSSYGRKLRERKSSSKSSPLKSNEKEILETTSHLLEVYSDPNRVFDYTSMQNLVKDNIPKDWCVCSLSLAEVEKKRYLILCRLEPLKEPLLVKINLTDKPEHSTYKKGVVCDLAASFDDDLLEKFKSLIEASQESMKIQDKKSWWMERVRLNTKLESTLCRLEDEWLQGWKGMLLGQYQDEKIELEQNFIADEISDRIVSAIHKNPERGLVKCLVNSFEHCTKDQIMDALQMLFGEAHKETTFEIFSQCLEKNKRKSESREDTSCTRKPMVLILDKTLQSLPWESIRVLKSQPVTRMPSIVMTSSHCNNYQDAITNGMAIKKCCYILNPKDDLKYTEEKFNDWFQSEGFHGIVGQPPTQSQFAEAITDNDLFIYCGHGSGQEYLGWSAVNRLQSNAVALLMGCSSGKLQVQGDLEAEGIVQYYLSAGCPAIVANLWDVTDKDIDCFLEKLLQLWLTGDRGRNLAECVSEARSACKLEYLNGAAPVVYGLPLFVKDT